MPRPNHPIPYSPHFHLMPACRQCGAHMKIIRVTQMEEGLEDAAWFCPGQSMLRHARNFNPKWGYVAPLTVLWDGSVVGGGCRIRCGPHNTPLDAPGQIVAPWG